MNLISFFKYFEIDLLYSFEAKFIIQSLSEKRLLAILSSQKSYNDANSQLIRIVSINYGFCKNKETPCMYLILVY